MFTTERLIIREITEDDYEALLNIYQKANNMQYILAGRNDWSLEEIKAKWRDGKYSRASKSGFWIVEHRSDAKVIGEAGLIPEQNTSISSMEIAYLLDETFWGQGLGTELCLFLLKHGFETLGLEKIKAGMYKNNIRSAKLMKKLDFKLARAGKTKSGIAFADYEITAEKYFNQIKKGS